MPKRTFSNKTFKTTRKKQRLNNDFFPASGVHNYMLNDPILDWIKHRKTSVSEVQEMQKMADDEDVPVESDRFFELITQKGKEFETNVISIITSKLENLSKKFPKKFPKKSPKLLQIAKCRDDIFSTNKYQETIDTIKKQVAVIYQGVLHGNQDFKAFGSPDLLVRSDIVNYLVDTPIDKVPKKKNGTFYYVVIDIKFCTMKLKVDGKSLCNESRMPANKGQIIVYNTLLGLAQGYEPDYCYILGRGWKYSQKGTNYECSRCDERLGSIDIRGSDSFYTEKISKALAWLENIRTNGHTWTINPPSVPELYPNMCNKYDNGNNTKKKIAVDIDEITQLWYAGVKHRERAHNEGIFKLTDSRLTTEILGFPQDTARTKTIDRMLKFNQEIISPGKIVIPKYIDNNPYDWQVPPQVEFFLDFETFSNIFDDFSNLPNMGGPNSEDEENKGFVFMIGLGVSIRHEGKVTWEYYNFRVPELTNEFEFQIFDQMYHKLDDITARFNLELGETNIYHWGNIEQSILERIYTKYDNKHEWEELNLVDFNKIFQEEAILIKGVYGFGLKQIGQGLINHGLINMELWDSQMANGLDVMVQAYNVYNTNMDHTDTINRLIKYNQIDVRMIQKIIDYLRKHHIPGILHGITKGISNIVDSLYDVWNKEDDN